MKLRDVQKKLAKEGFIGLAVIALLCAIVYGLSMFSDSYTEEITTLERDSSDIASQTSRLRDQFVKVQQNLDLYRTAFDKIAKQQLSIDNRQTARVKLEELKTRYFLSNVRLTISGNQDVPGHKYKTLSEVVVKSDVSITADALIDEDIYGFLYALENEMPGVVQITHFEIVRNQRPTDAGLRQIVDTGAPPLVSATIQFNWFGLKDLGLVTSGLDMPMVIAYAQ